MDGADFIRAFRALPGAREIPVVVVTVYEDRSYCYQALEAGATDFLLSPVDHVEFRARARNLLTLRKQQQLLEERTQELRRELVSSSEQHEAALRASELRLRRLIDTVPAIISAVDVHGRLTLINSAHQQLYGVEPATAIGRTLKQVYGEDYATKQSVLNAKVFETAETLPSFEQEVTSPVTDQERILLTTKSPLYDEAGRVADVVTVSLDITELKQAEARMRHQAGPRCADRAAEPGVVPRLPRSCARPRATGRGRGGGDAARSRSLQGDQRRLRAAVWRHAAQVGGRAAACLPARDRRDRPARRRRVRHPADRGQVRRRAAQPGAPPDRQLRSAVRPRRRGVPHQRQHRHHAVPGRRPGRRPAAQERRAGDVSGQVERPQRQLLLRPADESGGAPHRPARARAAPGVRRRPVHRPLPGAAGPGERPDRRHRGAAALAPPAARHGQAERVRRASPRTSA